MTFNQYKDAKTLFAAIETRFRGNEATKKTHLKQLYENFSATGTESLDLIFNRLQKLVSQLAVLDLEQIHKDDLEEMDLKWQLALLSMRANRFFQKTSKKITINGSDISGYDKSKVECFNSHKMGFFVRECRVPRNQENETRNQETTRQTVNVEDTSSKAMVAIDGAGFDWSYMADDEAPTNMAFMALSDSEVFTLRIDLSHTGLPEFAEPSVQRYGVKPIKVVTQKSSVKISAPVKENNGAPLIEDWEYNEKDDVESPPEKERKTVKPSVDKIEVEIPKQNDKPARRPVKYADMYRTKRPRELILSDKLSTASAKTLDNGEIELNATVVGHDKTITKASVRRHLKLADADGISTLPITEIFEQLALMGYVTNSDKLTFQKALFPTMLVTEQVSQGEGPTSPVGTQHTPTIIKSSRHLQNISITYRKTRTRTGRMDIKIPQSNVPLSAADDAITKEMHDGLGRATTTVSSLGAEQGSGKISKTQTKATPSGPSSLRTSSKGGPRCHFTMRDSPVQAMPQRLSSLPNELPLEEGNTSQSGKGSILLLELMAICTKL
nr:hypothetical protein [Tanacetum cinerariifolium]